MTWCVVDDKRQHKWVIWSVTFTWAVAVCGGLGDGAGEGAAADLGWTLVELLLLVCKLNLLTERVEEIRGGTYAKLNVLQDHSPERNMTHETKLSSFFIACFYNWLADRSFKMAYMRESQVPSSCFKFFWRTSLVCWLKLNFFVTITINQSAISWFMGSIKGIH